MRILEFMNNDFRQYSIYDNVRSIPNGWDGFKPSQRKIIHTLIKRGENADEIKVAQLGALCAMETDYHHGEGSLFSTIIGLAQDFTGSNNLNFLFPSGQFGSRHNIAAAAPRYIFTKFTDNFRMLFRKGDDQILEKQYSDGDEIEPKMYVPILPTILINGAEGMGTGYACKILSYNPADIRDYVLARVNNKNVKPLVPWYRGFTGNIFRNVENLVNPNQVVFEGKYEISTAKPKRSRTIANEENSSAVTNIRITEIPPNVELADYKKHLNKLKLAGTIDDWDDESVGETFNFDVKMPRAGKINTHEELMTMFKLVSRDTENVTVWDENGFIVEYKDVHELADSFVEWRVGIYEIRRLKLIEVLAEDSRYLSEKLRFVKYYLKHSKDFQNKKKSELVAMIEALKFTDTARLMGLPLWVLTVDEVAKLEKEIGDIEDKITVLKADTAKAMFTRELKELKF